MTHHPIYETQLKKVLSHLDFSRYDHQTIFVSGGTGMVGACILDLLGLWNRSFGGTISVIASTRNLSGVTRNTHPKERVQWISWDSTEPLCLPEGVTADYILHTASNADPANFARDPVGTLWGAMAGTHSVLEYARIHGCKNVLYLSSGEMYGQPEGACEGFTEDYCGQVNHSVARACYPTGKRGSEVLCQSYREQHQVSSVIARPCHLFGPTMLPQDSRATSDFLRSASEGKDILLKSTGQMERSHCYVVDCVSALFFLLIHGVPGEAYNIADQTYQMTIGAFAQEAAKAGGCTVRFEVASETESKGFSPVRRAVLSMDKLETLGWVPHVTQMKGSAIKDTIEIWTNQKQGCEYVE